MKNWIKVHKKGIIIAISFLVLGMIIAPKGTEIKEVVKEVVKVEYTKECEGFAIYKQIKVVDDGIIEIQGAMIVLLAEGSVALTKYDFDRFEEITTLLMNEMTPLAVEKLNQRTDLIKQLKK